MLIFFDDILIYNCSNEEHISHVKKVLFALSKPEFYVHKDKFVFDEVRLEYFGYWVSANGLATCLGSWKDSDNPTKACTQKYQRIEKFSRHGRLISTTYS